MTLGISRLFKKEEYHVAIDEQIVVIDIGNTKVVVIIAEMTPDRIIRVVGVGYESFPLIHRREHNVIVDDIDKATKGIQMAVSTATQMADVDEIREAYVGISGSCITLIESHGVVSVTRSQDKAVSTISEKDIDRVLENARDRVALQNSQVLHILPFEFIIDGKGGIRERPIRRTGLNLESKVNLVTTAHAPAQDLLTAINGAGIHVKDLIWGPLAISEAVLSGADKELGTLLLDIGGCKTDATVFYGGSVRYTTTINYGCDDVTMDIAKVLGLSIEKAEELKRKDAGLCRTEPDTPPIIFKIKGRDYNIDQEKLNEITFCRIDEILNEMILDDIKRSGWFDKISKIVITGGGALLQDIELLTKKIFEREVQIGKPTNLPGLTTRLDSPVFSTAVGLVLHATKDWKGQTKEDNDNDSGIIDKLIERVKGKLR